MLLKYKPQRTLKGKLYISFTEFLGWITKPVYKNSWRSDVLMKTAEKNTKLSDWGDKSFLNPLNILLESFEEEFNNKYFISKAAFYKNILRLLENRLYIQDELNQYPETKNLEIKKPLFIVSLPRTGTTLLHNLLCQDPNNRGLYIGECLRPCPPLNKKNKKIDMQKKAAIEYKEYIELFATDITFKHPVETTGFEECFFLMENSFTCMSFLLTNSLKEYDLWLKNSEFQVSLYRYYKQILQILLRRNKCDRWVLKSPVHLDYLDALLEVFPDACILQIHRDLVSVLPSFISLIMSLRGIFDKNLDIKSLRDDVLLWIDKFIDLNLKIRRNSNKGNFFDLKYSDLLKDPIQTVKIIYDYFGYEYSLQFEEKMHKWLQDHPKDKHGIHSYSLEDFDLDEEQIVNRYKLYYEQFIFNK
ncbi:MAG: hypothetical protein A2161_22545 [Candidatus Schekmanbacteria bacterium RBG_13_48_7]|uniref:Sulfotransferase n=1 Tax=Candidatus Schekmanbacteria bacterium RBG_13_48_7 TaxID=1817878 RepID=A0A1F7RT87_9BACT|nr:MAG: hypothetical protein A2161_22545 [Candidatus Schekmanbacteria bacterium RBG_13_48_7]